MSKTFFLSCLITISVSAAEPEIVLRDQARIALRRGVEYFRTAVAVEGSYLWQYSEDLSKREGEGVASATRGWVQPPGTPAVGRAFLEAYAAASDSYYLDAARETGQALIRGQLRSGGWAYHIDFDEKGRKQLAYRKGGSDKARNQSVLDDNTTQSALLFLVRLDRATTFKDPELHECVHYGLEALLNAQYPNGAWPQVFEGPPATAGHPVVKASFPSEWTRTWPGSQQYWTRYTLNDNLLADILETLFEVERTCEAREAGPALNQIAQRARVAAEKAGDFLMLAQLPEPQPAWAQQYDFEMHPTWARKFEPPAVTGGESQSALRVLLKLFRHTGHRRYLVPVPAALGYLGRSRLPDGRLARFYELRSNRPLYFTRDYQLTYSDADCPTHYAFKIGDSTDSISREYEALLNGDRDETSVSASKASKPPTSEVKRIIAAQDSKGRWVEAGGLRYQEPKAAEARIIRTATFIHNVQTLSRFLRAQPL